MARTKKEKAQAVIGIASKLGIKTSEFGASATLITYLSAQNQVTGEIGYAYASAAVAGAYILGRCILKSVEIIKQK